MKTRIYIFIYFLTLCGFLAAQDSDSLKFKSVDPYYFHLGYLKEDPALIIDVREPFEYRHSRLKGAINIPASGNLKRSADTISKEYALFFYCTTDVRSIHVAKFFSENGFTHIYSLDGGIVGWRKKGMEVDRKRKKR